MNPRTTPETRTTHRANPIRRVRANAAVAGLALALASGCRVVDAASLPAEPGVVVDMPVAQPPYQNVEPNWKQRMDQPYVYLELIGDYRETGRAFAGLARAMRDQGMRPSGAPFALFYDDPGTVPIAQLRSRACIPVDSPARPRAPLAADLLPSRTVVYAYAGGRYTDLPRAYPGLYAYMAKMNWNEAGPVREIYMVPPEGTQESDLIAEIQIPVGWAD